MINSPMAVELGNEIRQFLRRRGLTQKNVAQRINIVPSVFSQMLRGKVRFTIIQLEMLITFLHPDCGTREQWRNMFWSVDQGMESTSQEGCEHIKVLREKRGLSLPMLSNRTGIKTARLQEIENSGIYTLSDGESQAIGKVLGFRDSGSLLMSYSTASQSSLPLLYFDDFSFYDHKKPFAELVQERSQEKVPWEIFSVRPAAAILTDCSKVQLNLPGFVILVVTDRDESNSHKFELCCDRDGNYFIREKCGDAMQLYSYTTPDAVTGTVRWYLPLIDMVCKPFNLTLGASCQ